MEKLPFILANWGALSFVMYAIVIVTIYVAVTEKTSILNKRLNVLIITSFPLQIIGCIIYYIVRIRKHLKEKATENN